MQYSMAAVAPPLPTTMAEQLPMVLVVGPQFCKLSTVILTVTKKALSFSGGDFTVSDVNSGIMMKVGIQTA
jgi:hypothetical protein